MPIVKIYFYNSITEQDEYININFDIDYSFYKSITQLPNDTEIIKHLNYLLKCIDCTIIYDCGANCVLGSYTYELRIKEYYYFLLKIKNQFLYNEYLDKLIDQTNKNINFNYNNMLKTPSKPKKEVKKKVVKNEFVKQTTTDLFTGTTTYQYVNYKTNEIITSEDPNLLDSLNSKPKKEKKSKIVSMNSITFNFNKKCIK